MSGRHPLLTRTLNMTRPKFSGLIYDAFTDTNGTLLSAHTIAPINSIGATWDDNGGQFDISANRARAVAGGLYKVSSVEISRTDNYTVSVKTIAGCGAVARFQDASNSFVAYKNPATMYIYEYNGALTQRASSAITTGDSTVSIQVAGNTLTARHYTTDGVLEATISYTTAVYAAATRCGIFGVVGNTLDDFRVEAV